MDARNEQTADRSVIHWAKMSWNADRLRHVPVSRNDVPDVGVGILAPARRQSDTLTLIQPAQ
jgi:hypothetical protein